MSASHIRFFLKSPADSQFFAALQAATSLSPFSKFTIEGALIECSLKEAERLVLQAFVDQLPADYIVIGNVEISGRSQQRFEYHSVIIAPHAVYVAEVRDWRARNSASAKASFTSRWQSSNEPRTANVSTLSPKQPSRCACRGETRPSG